MEIQLIKTTKMDISVEEYLEEQETLEKYSQQLEEI